MTAGGAHGVVPDRLYQNVQSLISTRRSTKPGGDLRILDQCVQLLVEGAGWETLPQWRPCLLEKWSPESVESAVAKAWFLPDVEPLEQRYDALRPDDLIAMGRLGYKGQFGNQLFQYAWLRIYAESHGLVPATRFWIGRTLFGFDDPVYTEGKQLYKKNEFDLDMNIGILPVLTFLPDWWVFQEADVLAIPNSTFSLTSAMLNEKEPRCFRINPDTQRLVSFDPWNTDVLLVKGGGGGWEASRQKYLEKRGKKRSRARGTWFWIKAGLRKLM